MSYEGQIQKAEKHVPVLDAIRGLAISLVLFYHFIGIPIPDSILGRAIGSLAKSAWLGVDLFFVLSGFLITGILYDTRESRNYFRVFYARRFLRIFPLYYGFLFLLMIFTSPLQIEWGGRQFIYLAYLQNTGIVKHMLSLSISPFLRVNHLWSLAVEEQFYCLWPALVFLFKDRLKLMRLAVVLTGCSIFLRVGMVYMHAPLGGIYTFTPARADSLMMGALLALALRSSPGTRSKLTRAAWIVLPCSLALLVGLAWPYGRLDWEAKSVAIFGYTVIALASAALMTLSLTNPAVHAIINRPTLRLLGKYSYGIYILHYPIVTLSYYLDIPARLGVLSGGAVDRLLTSAAAALASIALAALSFHFYESRFLRLKRYFRYNFRDPPRDLDGTGASDRPVAASGICEPG
jgi:peptidoglycan/LPS O-acetylase OafA/YrhL